MNEVGTWAKLGDNFLGEASVGVSQGQALAARECARMCVERGWGPEAGSLRDLAVALEAFDAAPKISFDAQAKPAGAADSDWREFRERCSAEDPMMNFFFGRLEGKEWPSGDLRFERALAELRSLPAAWTSSVGKVVYARRSTAVVKDPRSAMSSADVRQWVESSKLLGVAAAAAEAALPALKKLRAHARKEKMGEFAKAAIEIAADVAPRLGRKRGFLAQSDHVEFIEGQDRFEPQKAYALYLPANHIHGNPEGFMGSKAGMDLGSAKLFESEARAIGYCEKNGLSHCALVEVDVRVARVAKMRGSFPAEGLNEALARAERAAIKAALEGAKLEELRARLAEMEAAAGMADPAKPARKTRL